MRYHLISVLSIIAAVPLGSLPKPSPPRWDDMHIKHSWSAIPRNWESLGPPLNSTTISLHIALKPHRESALIDALYEVSDPDHLRYRAHLSKEEVAELVAPHPETIELVYSWLRYHGVPSSSVSVTHGGTTLTVSGVSIFQADAILDASYQLYRHVKTGKSIVRTVGYSLPLALHGHVQTVVPTTHFASRHKRSQTPYKRSAGAAASMEKPEMRVSLTMLSNRASNGNTTPSFLHWLYSTFAYTPARTDRKMLGVIGFMEDYPNPDDLVAFMSRYCSVGDDATFDVVQVNGGGNDPSRPSDEANLDIQYASAMAYPTPLTFYSVGDEPLDDEDVAWLHYILSEPFSKVPKTITTSYNFDENDWTREHADYVCSLYALLSASGISVLISSGNDGVGEGNCFTNDGTYQFFPQFPATCPWVTTVGGTAGCLPEVAASLSGGGFSNYFRRPSYQHEAVAIYLQHLGNQYAGLFNNSGRGIPDIAAQALRFPIFVNGVEKVVSGTSGSVPVVAGIIALLNDLLISQGRRPLGFLNPFLYGRLRKGLNDITLGSNPGCNTDGFPATTGWDPVTGLGTLDFENLVHILDLNPPRSGT